MEPDVGLEVGVDASCELKVIGGDGFLGKQRAASIRMELLDGVMLLARLRSPFQAELSYLPQEVIILLFKSLHRVLNQVHLVLALSVFLFGLFGLNSFPGLVKLFLDLFRCCFFISAYLALVQLRNFNLGCFLFHPSCGLVNESMLLLLFQLVAKFLPHSLLDSDVLAGIILSFEHGSCSLHDVHLLVCWRANPPGHI